MGGSSSKSTVSKLTDIALNVVNKNIQSCVTSATQSQLIKIQNVHGDVDLSGTTQKQGISIDMKCAFSSATQNQIQDQLSSEISNLSKSTTGDITSGKASSVSTTDIKEILKSNINNENISQQVSTAIQQQTISVLNVGGSVTAANINQEQGITMVTNAIVNSEQFTTALTKVADRIDSTATSESKGIFTSLFDMVNGVVGSFFGSWTMIIVAIIVAFLVIAFFIFMLLRGSPRAPAVPSSIAQMVRSQLGT